MPSFAALCLVCCRFCKSHSALTPAVQKSAPSVTSNASGVQVQHRNHLLFPPGHCSAHQLAMAWARVLAAVRMVRVWGWLLSLCFLGYQKCWEMPVGEWESTWYGLFRLPLLSLYICSWVHGASSLRWNFSATWWILDWPFFSLVYVKNKETYLNSAGCP